MNIRAKKQPVLAPEFIPASIFQHHPKAKVFIDEPAAADLKVAPCYRWVYNGSPE